MATSVREGLSKETVVELWDLNSEKARKGMSVKGRPSGELRCSKTRRLLGLSH